ncbi:hypothetical protein GCM10017744_026940 [Streptomyces antimycoticus]|uniref:DNA-3-methyladenine glycosylase I n=1 Tax=Streptomyces antimycoticus TaxID=68175 RepID=A0A4D4KJI1_9ACTN|nr:DNA-3-methyladenine glycosylase I [Streptomyces antimycoticus]GDY46658.1 hypothetical protein SANT12839_075400 [Streptomyces antimycoticus]
MTDRRCAWALSSDAMAACHDTEWGRPAHDDRHLFEMLLLEGVQAGPSWSTVLTKRENYRRALEAAGAAVEVRPSWACRPRRRPHGPECRPGPAPRGPAGVRRPGRVQRPWPVAEGSGYDVRLHAGEIYAGEGSRS